jgi:putative transposase
VTGDIHPTSTHWVFVTDEIADCWCLQHLGVQPDFVQHLNPRGFVSLPGRWIVERTFAWLGKCRPLSKDYEQLPAVSETWVYLSMIHLMLRRLPS